ncbi:hypothetical protein ACNVED_10020 [Legionella sp. D16C41]|uniref:hypothetical protein n=1 Tax=Legionella sp. D16C41 TaxID=3402688 RepID=UPI003AF89D20
MAYDVPDYVFLKNATDRLQQSFAQLTKRYTAPSYKVLRERLLKLDDLYKQKLKEKDKRSWIKCLPDKTRLEQIGCIMQLAGNMPSEQTTLKEDIIERAKSILIGASLYRYTRIDNSYKVLFGFFGKAQDNSALNMALYDILEISEANNIDSLTWASCCSDYRDYLLKDKNYTSYSYIDHDPDFFDNLNTMITSEQAKALPMTKQLQYILFIQSVHKMLDSYPTKIMQIADKLKALLGPKSKINYPIDKEEVLKLLKKLSVEDDVYTLLKRIIPEDYAIDYVETRLVATDDKRGEIEFTTDIRDRINVYCQYALLGSYVLVLTKINELQRLNSSANLMDYNERQLLDTLKKAVKFAIAEQEGNLLDDETRNFALTSLQNFIDLKDNILMNNEVWGGTDLFKGEFHRQLVDVRARLSEPAEIENSFTM